MLPILYIVVPCYNEEEVLPITSGMFLEKLRRLEQEWKISPESRVLFVDDGSKDSTWQIICDLSEKDRHFKGIRQSRNRGHQNAVLACENVATQSSSGQLSQSPFQRHPSISAIWILRKSEQIIWRTLQDFTNIRDITGSRYSCALSPLLDSSYRKM